MHYQQQGHFYGLQESASDLDVEGPFNQSKFSTRQEVVTIKNPDENSDEASSIEALSYL